MLRNVTKIFPRMIILVRSLTTMSLNHVNVIGGLSGIKWFLAFFPSGCHVRNAYVTVNVIVSILYQYMSSWLLQ